LYIFLSRGCFPATGLHAIILETQINVSNTFFETGG
jgi:hypothetical protein